MSDASGRAIGAIGVPGDLADGTVAVGWATVELERAEIELGARLPRSARFVDAAPSIALGARCRRTSTPIDGVVIVLLEPATEGRIAGFLARFGEGWAATWTLEDASPPADPAVPERPGPLGPERLAPRPAPSGPFQLWLRVATIEP